MISLLNVLIMVICFLNFTGFVEQQASARGKHRIRGGQTLRDTLFAATESRQLAKRKRK